MLHYTTSDNLDKFGRCAFNCKRSSSAFPMGKFPGYAMDKAEGQGIVMENAMRPMCLAIIRVLASRMTSQQLMTIRLSIQNSLHCFYHFYIERLRGNWFSAYTCLWTRNCTRFLVRSCSLSFNERPFVDQITMICAHGITLCQANPPVDYVFNSDNKCYAACKMHVYEKMRIMHFNEKNIGR